MTRVGNRERERSALALKRHYVDGRLDEDELSERLELVVHARSRGDLRAALRQLPRWSDLDHLAGGLRHAALVGVMTLVWLMLSATLFVAFVVWVALRGASVGALLAFPGVWIVLSMLIYRHATGSRWRTRSLTSPRR
jgi:hypothetical protein